MPNRYLIPFALAVGLVVAAQGRSDENDEAVLTTNKIPTDGPSLIAYFQKRTLADDTRTKVTKLIDRLGADTFKEREQAGNDLEDLGGLVRAQLAQATKHKDREICRRARRILIARAEVAHGGVNAAAAPRDLHVGHAGGAQLLLLIPRAAEDGVRMRVGETWREHAALAVDDRRARMRGAQ